MRYGNRTPPPLVQRRRSGGTLLEPRSDSVRPVAERLTCHSVLRRLRSSRTDLMCRWKHNTRGSGAGGMALTRSRRMAHLAPGIYLIINRPGWKVEHSPMNSNTHGANIGCRSPNLNAFAERWVRSVRDECLGKLNLFGESSLRRALTQFTEHYHSERNHQGKGNALLFPGVEEFRQTSGPSIRCRERLGGLLKYYYPRVA